MDTHLSLVPDGNDLTRGLVKPIAIKDGTIIYGLSVGRWVSNTHDGNIHVILTDTIDNIIHEPSPTRRSINAEIRATEKALNGVEIKPTIVYDPKTRRFKEVILAKE